MVASRSFFRGIAFAASSLLLVVVAAAPAHQARVAAQAARQLDERRWERAEQRTDEARLRVQISRLHLFWQEQKLNRLREQLERASRTAPPRAGDFPPLPRHARLD
ncbi:MAG TPA: hypothetical protein VF997_09670 [Polyangia bacterium]